MTEKEKFEIQLLIENAFAAARLATDKYLRDYPNQWFPCGFAWVSFSGRSPVVKVLKEKFPHRRLSKGYPKGIDIWNPSDNNTQCMDAKEAGARAFAEVINKGGYECTYHSRMD